MSNTKHSLDTYYTLLHDATTALDDAHAAYTDAQQKEKEAIEKAIFVFTQSVKKAQKKYVEYEKKTGGIDV